MEIFSVVIKLYCVLFFFSALYFDVFAIFLFNNLLNSGRSIPYVVEITNAILISDSAINMQIIIYVVNRSTR